MMEVDTLKKTSNKNITRYDAEITILHGTLAEVYYLLKDRRNKGIEDAMSHIETIFPDLKNYEYAQI